MSVGYRPGQHPVFSRAALQPVEDWSATGLRTLEPSSSTTVWLYDLGESWPLDEIVTPATDYLRYVEEGDLLRLLGTRAPGSRAGNRVAYGPIRVEETPRLQDLCKALARSLTLSHDPPNSPSRLYVSRKGTTSGLHWDGRPTTLVQLHGTKQGMLFAPSATARLQPFPGLTGPNSGVDPFSPSSKPLPPSLSVNLKPGDMITIPTGWWHCFRSTSPQCTSYSLW